MTSEAPTKVHVQYPVSHAVGNILPQGLGTSHRAVDAVGGFHD